MMEKVRSYDEQPITEVHIVGGVHPKMDIYFFADLLKQIKAHRPDLHIKGFTAVELDYMFRKAKLSRTAGMQLLHDAGLDSLPGGGAVAVSASVDCTIRVWHRPGGSDGAGQWGSCARLQLKHANVAESVALTILPGWVQNDANGILDSADCGILIAAGGADACGAPEGGKGRADAPDRGDAATSGGGRRPGDRRPEQEVRCEA